MSTINIILKIVKVTNTHILCQLHTLLLGLDDPRQLLLYIIQRAHVPDYLFILLITIANFFQNLKTHFINTIKDLVTIVLARFFVLHLFFLFAFEHLGYLFVKDPTFLLLVNKDSFTLRFHEQSRNVDMELIIFLKTLEFLAQFRTWIVFLQVFIIIIQCQIIVIYDHQMALFLLHNMSYLQSVKEVLRLGVFILQSIEYYGRVLVE